MTTTEENRMTDQPSSATTPRLGAGGVPVRPETDSSAETSSGPLAMMHREMLGEWHDVGCPPLCDCCGGFYDSRGGWMMLPTCAESPLSHDEICVGKAYRNDVCPTCAKRLGWTS